MKSWVLFLLLVAAVQADCDPNHLESARHDTPTRAEWQKIMSLQPIGNQRDNTGGHLRIIGGSKATRGQFPWQAAVVLDGASFCSGSLITSTFVLLAAQCTNHIITFTVTLGATTIWDAQSGTVTQVTCDKIQYNNSTYEKERWSDIALLKLPTAVANSSYISPVRLPLTSQVSDDLAGSTVRASGWGQTSGGSGFSNNLLFVDVTVINNTQCAKTYASCINEDKMCTVGVNGSNPCHGDSGGPLVLLEKDGVYTQVGIGMYGSGCISSDPVVYTRVTSYLDWLSNQTGLIISP